MVTKDVRKDSGVVSIGDEDAETGGEEVMMVGEHDPHIKITMKGKDGDGREISLSTGPWLDTRPWTGRGTPPSREEMVGWLTRMDEKELAQNQRAILIEEKRRAEEAAGRDAAAVSTSATPAMETPTTSQEREVVKLSSEEEGTSKGKGSGKGKKGKKSKKGTREKDAVKKHVRRLEEGRSK